MSTETNKNIETLHVASLASIGTSIILSLECQNNIGAGQTTEF